MAWPRCAGGNTRIISVCDIGMIGPPHRPCMMRKRIRKPSDGASPQSAEQIPKPTMPATKTRSAPNRAASHPVSGTIIASATE